MPLIPATFLAGALLTLLVPAVLLVALVTWYLLFFRRVEDTIDHPAAAGPPAPMSAPAKPDRPSGE